jgi:hypothetical protein
MKKKDITQKDVNRAMKAFGLKVKEQSASRQDFIIAKLREEMDRLRPQAARLLHGTKA